MDQTNDSDKFQEGLKLHMGIAEQGKVYAVEGDHKLTLLYYRAAMNMSMQAKDPELFFRVYQSAGSRDHF